MKCEVEQDNSDSYYNCKALPSKERVVRFNQDIIRIVWNGAIDTMMGVIDLHPTIDLSIRDRIASIAKGLKK